MSKTEAFLEYLRTIIWTIFTIMIFIVILLAFIQHSVYNSKSTEIVQDNGNEKYFINLLIEKNKYLAIKSPQNYRVNLKLGILYELYKDYTNSEIQFKLAMEKAPYYEFVPQYRLARLYLEQNKLENAQGVMDKISEKPDKKLIDYKGDIYNRLGDKYYNLGDYETAIIKYQKSLSYYEIINSKELKNVKNSLASAYVYLAEGYVKDLRIQDAVASLNTAISIVNAPILKYKLALLLMKSNPDLAYQYFDEVFKKEPSIINFDVYYTFLLTMADASSLAGNDTETELYKYKAKKFKEYFQKNILAVSDITMENASGSMTIKKWSRKYNINLELQFKNISSKPLTSLFVEIVFKDNSGIITEHFKQVVDPATPLNPGELSPTISIKTMREQKIGTNIKDNVIAEIYVSKTEKSYKLYLKTIQIKALKK